MKLAVIDVETTGLKPEKVDVGDVWDHEDREVLKKHGKSVHEDVVTEVAIAVTEDGGTPHVVYSACIDALERWLPFVLKTRGDSLEDYADLAWCVSAGHITWEEIEGGVKLEVAAPTVGYLLSEADAVAAYNAPFDTGFLRAFGFPLTKRVNDLMVPMTSVCKLRGRGGEYKWPKFEEAYFHAFGKFPSGVHRAGTDAVAEAELANVMIERGWIKGWKK